jgi:hypothetical protein
VIGYLVVALHDTMDLEMRASTFVVRLLESVHVVTMVVMLALLRSRSTRHRGIIITYILWLWFSSLLSDIRMIVWRSGLNAPPSVSTGVTILIELPVAIMLIFIVMQRWGSLGKVYLNSMRVAFGLTVILCIYDVIFEVTRDFNLINVSGGDMDAASVWYTFYSWYCSAAVLSLTFIAYSVSLLQSRRTGLSN